MILRSNRERIRIVAQGFYNEGQHPRGWHGHWIPSGHAESEAAKASASADRATAETHHALIKSDPENKLHHIAMEGLHRDRADTTLALVHNSERLHNRSMDATAIAKKHMDRAKIDPEHADLHHSEARRELLAHAGAHDREAAKLRGQLADRYGHVDVKRQAVHSDALHAPRSAQEQRDVRSATQMDREARQHEQMAKEHRRTVTNMSYIGAPGPVRIK